MLMPAFLAVLSACLLSGCGPEDEGLTYCTVEPILEDKCLRCHSDPPENGAPFPLTSYDRIESNISRIEGALEVSFMPPTGLPVDPPVEDLTEDERDLLLEWIELGAPAGSCE
jgi:uncharacterized membrane protein